jgi:hypothetical protein
MAVFLKQMKIELGQVRGSVMTVRVESQKKYSHGFRSAYTQDDCWQRSAAIDPKANQVRSVLEPSIENSEAK